MAKMWQIHYLPIFMFASCRAAAMLLRRQKDSVIGGKVALELVNQNDMSFTSAIKISNQAVPMIMDTGSFEMVVFKEGCFGCPEHTPTYFRPSKADDDYSSTGLVSVAYYGSGDVTSNASFANVRLGQGTAAESTGQVFWLASSLDLGFSLDKSTAGVFGIGPPASALKFAKMELKSAISETQQLPKDERKQYMDVLASMKKVVDLAKAQDTFLGSTGSKVFSVCLKPGWGENGKVILNDDQRAIQRTSPLLKTTSSGFWEVDIEQVQIGQHSLGEAGQCTAIMDSGTSLIGLPSDVYLAVVDRVSKLAKTNGGCDNLDNWPRLEFNVGAGDKKQKLSLHASSYVGKVDYYYSFDDLAAGNGDADDRTLEQSSGKRSTPWQRRDDLQTRMPHLKSMNAERGKQCQAMVFDMDGMGDSTCQFLFGLPVFREYYVSHFLSKNGEASSMAFSKGASDCSGPVDGHELEHTKSESPSSPLVVNPKKIRFPRHAGQTFHSFVEQKPISN